MEPTGSSIPPMERYRQQLSSGVSVVVSLLCNAFRVLLTSIMGRLSQEIPPGATLHARSRTEMARKAV
jgi:hypothetical protein